MSAEHAYTSRPLKAALLRCRSNVWLMDDGCVAAPTESRPAARFLKTLNRHCAALATTDRQALLKLTSVNIIIAMEVG